MLTVHDSMAEFRVSVGRGVGVKYKQESNEGFCHDSAPHIVGRKPTSALMRLPQAVGEGQYYIIVLECVLLNYNYTSQVLR